VFHTALVQVVEDRLRVAHAAEVGTQSQFLYWPEQEGFQLPGTLIIAPVADPDQVAPGEVVVRFPGIKDPGIRGFVPGPDVVVPAVRLIDAAQYVAECEDAIVAVQAETAEPLGVADSPVVGVVEQQAKIRGSGVLLGTVAQ